ncbi:MAG TPA: GNAT family N-acetyltransferase [Phycicoccus sp.]|nr:GNAT family N-acetyltransferase [Phycicoccus sp.]HQH08337.1 GNAT family N-acetyltransferase [Phycicoccus sp.]HQK30996.1 GNAT family N-acetyltransferase [Phycicoccus sp.]
MTRPPSRVDPLDVAWPRHTAQTTLRPVSMDDVDAMWSYRRLPEVCRFLSHGPLTREEVVTRVEGRLSGVDPTPGRLVRGVAIIVDGEVVGDAMLRVQADDAGHDALWIGYALHPSIAGRGVATEVAREMVVVAGELGMPVWADAQVDNAASRRVLEKAGFVPVATGADGDTELLVFTVPQG